MLSANQYNQLINPENIETLQYVDVSLNVGIVVCFFYVLASMIDKGTYTKHKAKKVLWVGCAFIVAKIILPTLLTSGLF